MTDTERLKELIDLAGFKNFSKFCEEIDYGQGNLSHYLNGHKALPNSELIVKVMKHFPKWNLRYWLLGEGNQILSEDELVIITEPAPIYKDPNFGELMGLIGFLRKEIERKDAEIVSLKNEITKT